MPRFSPVALALLLTCFTFAFMAPTAWPNRVRTFTQNLFVPVSAPVHTVAGGIKRLVAGVATFDEGSPGQPRNRDDVYKENRELRAQLASMQGQLERLAELNEERGRVGEVRKFCRPARVMGVDSSGRALLHLAASTTGDIREKQEVLCGEGLVGRISRAGPLGASVQLITDRGFTVTGTFARLVDGPQGKQWAYITSRPAVATGNGAGEMVIDRVPMSEVKQNNIGPNDWFVLDDRTWNSALHRSRVGIVQSVRPSPQQPLFAEVVIRPVTNLLELNEVMVMTKGP
jgi:cell shape-determining protein MreC